MSDGNLRSLVGVVKIIVVFAVFSIYGVNDKGMLVLETCMRNKVMVCNSFS